MTLYIPYFNNKISTKERIPFFVGVIIFAFFSLSIRYHFTQYPIHIERVINKELICIFYSAIWAGICGLISLFFSNKEWCAKYFPPFTHLIVGGFSIDTLFILMRGNSYLMLVHHIIMIFILTQYPYYQFDHSIVIQGLYAEIPMPIFYYGRYMALMGYNKSSLFIVVVSIAAIGYGLLRPINFTSLLFKISKYKHKKIAWIIFTPITLLNYYWFIKAISGALKLMYK